MAKDLKWMKFCGEDFFSSESVMAMPDSAQLIYLAMLWHQWNNASLPDDPVLIARLVRRDRSEVEQAWPLVRQKFELNSEGRLVNLKQDALRIEVEASAQKNADKAKVMRERKEAKRIIDSKESEEGPSKRNDTCHSKEASKRTENSYSKEPCKDSYKESDKEPLQRVKNGELRTSTVSSETDGGPSPGPLKPFDEVKLVLSLVCEDLGWEPPIDKDIRRNLKEDSALRQLVKLFGAPGAAELFCWAYREWKGRCSWEAVFDKRNQLRDSVQGRSTEANTESHLPDHIRYRKEPMEGIDFWRRSPDSGVELKPGQVLIGIEPERCVISKTGEKLDTLFNFDEWYQRRGQGVPAA